MRHSWLDNLRVISEYVFYDDAPALLGARKSELARWIKGNGSPKDDVQVTIARIAGKMRRKQAQVKRFEREDVERKARREIRSTLRLLSQDELKLPDYLPPFLRYHENGMMGSPVFIYDFRRMKQNDILQFFRFMKTILPSGVFFLTYEVKPGGTSPGGTKNWYQDKTSILSTHYMEFCQNLAGMPGDSCAVLTDLEFLEIYNEINSVSAKRRVIECGVSYPRPKYTVPHYQLTPEEIADDIARGADPITGKRVIWQD